MPVPAQDAPNSSEIEWAILELQARSDTIRLYRRYYDGDHDFPFSTGTWKNAFGKMFERFRDNLCPAVVDAKADRLQINGITGTDDAVNKAISTIWERERIEYRQGEIIKNSLKDGDAFVMVWPDQNNLARFFVQRGDRIACRYAHDPQGVIEIAAKLWPEYDLIGRRLKARWRLNLYWADHIERYVTKSEQPSDSIPEKPDMWDKFSEPPVQGDADEENVLRNWAFPNDFGEVPVFPFPNNADYGAYGRSELKDVIPLQDALNKSIADMLVGGEFVALPQRWIAGMEVELDNDGQPKNVPWQAGIDRILALGNPNAKFGQFDAADLTGFLKEQEAFKSDIARVSRTPLHYFELSGAYPSGEALIVAERPLTASVKDRAVSLGTGFARSMAFALKIESTVVDPETINVTWLDTSYKDPQQEAAMLTIKKDMGVPDEQLWLEMGYDDEQITKFTAAKLERQATMQAAFDAGTGGINPSAPPPPGVGG